jgi:hypothetical protein
MMQPLLQGQTMTTPTIPSRGSTPDGTSANVSRPGSDNRPPASRTAPRAVPDGRSANSTVSTNPASLARDSAPPDVEPNRDTPEERHQKIAQRAYLRAEQRGFEPGNELNDWLAAEQEVDARSSLGLPS